MLVTAPYVLAPSNGAQQQQRLDAYMCAHQQYVLGLISKKIQKGRAAAKRPKYMYFRSWCAAAEGLSPQLLGANHTAWSIFFE